MTGEKSAVLSVRDLIVEFRSQGNWRPAVKGVSFDLHGNETLAVVGESGSGKSVTALSIMRLLPQVGARIAGGDIRFEGQDLSDFTQAQMADLRGNSIAMIFQEPMTSLNPTMTVGDQIAEPLMTHRGLSRREAKAETLRLLDRVRIASAPTRFADYPHQFSGGMRQRIMIAMALACRPRLLIADEPTTALDVTIQAQILQLIKELQDEEQMSVLFITHDMGVVAEIADRVQVMRHGEIVESGVSLDVFGRPRHPYTKMLLHAVPRLGSMEGADKPRRFDLIDETGEIVPQARSEASIPPGATAETVLKVDGLTTRFDMRGGILRRIQGRVHAVENVSFELKKGETLALVGESGCGKSTTGRSILRLVEPSSGSVEIAGQDVMKLSTRRLRDMRRSMQMIFQDPFASLDPRQRIGDAIAEPILLHGLADRATVAGKVATLLERVGLEAGFAHRYPHEFSGGQRQRICIARALSLEPRLIIADEAVSALDVSIKAQIVNLMIDLQERLGLSYLFISHDMAVVERISHRVAVMLRGEIVEIGPRSQIFGNPQHPYTKTLLSAVLVPDPARRHERKRLEIGEIKSTVRPPDYEPPARNYYEVSQDHIVQEWETA